MDQYKSKTQNVRCSGVLLSWGSDNCCVFVCTDNSELLYAEAFLILASQGH